MDGCRLLKRASPHSIQTLLGASATNSDARVLHRLASAEHTFRTFGYGCCAQTTPVHRAIAQHAMCSAMQLASAQFEFLRQCRRVPGLATICQTISEPCHAMQQLHQRQLTMALFAHRAMLYPSAFGSVDSLADLLRMPPCARCRMYSFDQDGMQLPVSAVSDA